MRRHRYLGKMGPDRGTLYRQVPETVLRGIRDRRQGRDRLQREPGTRGIDDDDAGPRAPRLLLQQERHRAAAHAARHSLLR